MSNKISNDNNNNNEIKTFKNRGRPSKKVVLEEFEIITTNDLSPESGSEPKKIYNNLVIARETRKNNIIQFQEQKQQQVQEIINTLQSSELLKLNDKYSKLQNKLLKLIK
jgi:hypothetical protein